MVSPGELNLDIHPLTPHLKRCCLITGKYSTAHLQKSTKRPTYKYGNGMSEMIVRTQLVSYWSRMNRAGFYITRPFFTEYQLSWRSHALSNGVTRSAGSMEAAMKPHSLVEGVG
jgi:hypothetical protein